MDRLATHAEWYNLGARIRIAAQQGDDEAALALAEQMRVLALAASDHPCELMARWSAARLRTVRGDAGAVKTFAALRPEIEALEDAWHDRRIRRPDGRRPAALRPGRGGVGRGSRCLAAGVEP